MKLALVSLLCLVCLVKAQYKPPKRPDISPIDEYNSNHGHELCALFNMFGECTNDPDHPCCDAWCAAYGIGGHDCCNPAIAGNAELKKKCKADRQQACSKVWKDLRRCNLMYNPMDPQQAQMKALCCPLCSDIHDKVLADPLDCSSGYKCGGGRLFEKKQVCPDGKAWNEKNQQCIKDSTCTKDAWCLYYDNTDECCLVALGQAPPEWKDGCDEDRADICGGVDCNDADHPNNKFCCPDCAKVGNGLVADPASCLRFYECEGGKVADRGISKSCSGQFGDGEVPWAWNQKKNQCTQKEKTDCKLGGDAAPGGRYGK